MLQNLLDKRGSLNLEDLEPFDITLYMADGTRRVMLAVKRIVFGIADEDIVPLPLPSFWVECSAVPADLERIRDTITDYGYCDVLVVGRIQRAVKYVPPTTGWNDDLIYDTGARLSYVWRVGYRPNPTRVSRLVDGFGARY